MVVVTQLVTWSSSWNACVPAVALTLAVAGRRGEPPTARTDPSMVAALSRAFRLTRFRGLGSRHPAGPAPAVARGPEGTRTRLNAAERARMRPRVPRTD